MCDLAKLNSIKIFDNFDFKPLACLVSEVWSKWSDCYVYSVLLCFEFPHCFVVGVVGSSRLFWIYSVSISRTGNELFISFHHFFVPLESLVITSRVPAAPNGIGCGEGEDGRDQRCEDITPSAERKCKRAAFSRRVLIACWLAGNLIQQTVIWHLL